MNDATSACPGRGFHIWRRVGIDPQSGYIKFRCSNTSCRAEYLAEESGGRPEKFRNHHNPEGV